MSSEKLLSGRLAVAASQNIEEKNYWLKKLSGEPVKHSFPGDFHKRAKNARRIDALSHIFPGDIYSQLMKLSKGSDVRFYIIMVTGVVLLLNRYTYNCPEDITVGTSIYRQETDVDFINSVLVLSSKVGPHMTFKDFIMEVGQVIREANLHQNYPIEALLQLLNMEPAHDEDFTLFDVAILMESIQDKKYLNQLHLNIIFICKPIDKGMELTVEYNCLLYKKDTIARMTSHLFNLLKNALFNMNTQVSQLDILSEKEKKEILFDFNNTKAEYSQDKTMHLLFQEQAAKTPANIAVICHGDHLTYQQLNQITNRLARELRKKGLKPNRFAAVIMDRSIQMVIGVMAILKAGGAYVPLEPYLPDARISGCVSSLKVECLLTNRLQLSRLAPLSGQLPELTRIFCLDEIEENKETEELFKYKELIRLEKLEKNPAEDLEPAASPEDIAYVIFTSGTTGTPKGVVVQHRPVINIIQWVNSTFEVKSPDKLLFVVSLSFDLSVYDIFGILASGAAIRVASNQEVKAPERLLEIIFNEEITFWDSAPAALQMLVPYLQNISTLHTDKSKLRLVFLSGDWIPVTMPDVLKESFTGVKVISLGGATEATIWSNFYPVETVDPQWASIPYGKPLQNSKYYILDRFLTPCPIGVPGDLYIGGECLAKGYFADETLTEKKFVNNPFASGEKMYKTGDLARWFPDGNMEFLGRRDSQVKIRGYRIELGEIESQLLRHDNIREAVVIARGEERTDKYLCAYYTTESELTSTQLSEHLSGTLPDYMIPSYFLRLDHIPLTPNGKVDRKKLPEPVAAVGTREYTAPQGEIEETLVEIWTDILGLEKEKISVNADFFELGGHSLKATQMISLVHKKLNVKIPLAEVFKLPFIKRLSGYISGENRQQYIGIALAEKKEFYKLSSAQKRLYVIHRLYPTNTGYNIFQAFYLEGNVEKRKLEAVFRLLIKRHGALRTSFEIVEAVPVQRIHDDAPFEIDDYRIQGDFSTGGNAAEDDITGIINNFIRPFELSKRPLLRIGLIHPSSSPHQEHSLKGRYILMVDIHHIITDAVSLSVFINDFIGLYTGKELAPLKLHYKDFSEWQNKLLQSEEIKTQENYWLNRFKGHLPILDLATDYPRPSLQTFACETIAFELDIQLTSQLRKLLKKTGTTYYIVLLAVFNILLSNYSHQEDIIVGSAVAGRRFADLEKIIGIFVNMLPMRNYPADSRSFREFLREVKENALGAYENQDYQFDELVLKLGIKREYGKNPLFDTQFTFQNVEMTRIDIPGLKLTPYEYELGMRNFDLSLNGFEYRNKVIMELKFLTTLFKRSTVEKMVEHYIEILKQVLKNDDIKLKDISVSHDLIRARSFLSQSESVNFEF